MLILTRMLVMMMLLMLRRTDGDIGLYGETVDEDEDDEDKMRTADKRQERP